eukprot:3634573-Pleurochrysis_carterae.AAC.1
MLIVAFDEPHGQSTHDAFLDKFRCVGKPVQPHSYEIILNEKQQSNSKAVLSNSESKCAWQSKYRVRATKAANLWWGGGELELSVYCSHGVVVAEKKIHSGEMLKPASLHLRARAGQNMLWVS